MRSCAHWSSRLLYFRLPKFTVVPISAVMGVLIIGGIREGLNEEMKSLPRCPRCFARLVLRWSRLTTYLACPNYPNCKRPIHLPKRSQGMREHRWAA